MRGHMDDLNLLDVAAVLSNGTPRKRASMTIP